MLHSLPVHVACVGFMFEISLSAAEGSGVIGTMSAISETIVDMHPEILNIRHTDYYFGERILRWFFPRSVIFDTLTSTDWRRGVMFVRDQSYRRRLLPP